MLYAYQPDIPESCTADVLSFTADIEALQTLEGQSAMFALWVGWPPELVPDTSYSFTGTGTVTEAGGSYAITPSDGIDGTITVSAASALAPELQPLAWIGMDVNGPAEGALWQIGSVTFEVEMTCPDPEPTPTPTPSPTAHALPATGAESSGLAGTLGAVGAARRGRCGAARTSPPEGVTPYCTTKATSPSAVGSTTVRPSASA